MLVFQAAPFSELHKFIKIPLTSPKSGWSIFLTLFGYICVIYLYLKNSTWAHDLYVWQYIAMAKKTRLIKDLIFACTFIHMMLFISISISLKCFVWFNWRYVNIISFEAMAWYRQTVSHYLNQCWQHRWHFGTIGHNKLCSHICTDLAFDSLHMLFINHLCAKQWFVVVLQCVFMSMHREDNRN